MEATLRVIYITTRTPKLHLSGERLYEDFSQGLETVPKGWDHWITYPDLHLPGNEDIDEQMFPFEFQSDEEETMSGKGSISTGQGPDGITIQVTFNGPSTFTRS